MSASVLRPLSAAVVLSAVLSAAFATAAPALAADPITLTLKNNRFAPNAVTAPAGERLQIVVKNEDSTPAEFESHDLRVEKIVTPGGKITVTVGPLKPGAYKFFDEYHPDTAQGTLTVVNKGQ